jgi:hypothetical protein
LATQKADPKAEIQLSDYARVIERLLLKLERAFRIVDLPLLRKLDADFRIVVSVRTKAGREAFVDLVAQRDFDPLQRSIQGFTERRIPHVEAQRLRGVAAGDRDIALQAQRGDAACESHEIVNVV